MVSLQTICRRYADDADDMQTMQKTGIVCNESAFIQEFQSFADDADDTFTTFSGRELEIRILPLLLPAYCRDL